MLICVSTQMAFVGPDGTSVWVSVSDLPPLLCTCEVIQTFDGITHVLIAFAHLSFILQVGQQHRLRSSALHTMVE